MKRYWIAINGSSCAASVLPWEMPKTSPIAEILVGFLTVEEADKAQFQMLNEPIEKIEQIFASWFHRDDVQMIRNANSEPQTDCVTVWMEEN